MMSPQSKMLNALVFAATSHLTFTRCMVMKSFAIKLFGSLGESSTIINHVQGVSKKTLRKFNRLSCIINVAKQFNFYIGRKNSYLAFH